LEALLHSFRPQQKAWNKHESDADEALLENCDAVQRVIDWDFQGVQLLQNFYNVEGDVAKNRVNVNGIQQLANEFAALIFALDLLDGG
jgi:hypothetical protein